MYSLLTEVIEQQRSDRKVVIDELNTMIGIRKINFTANQGFILNDEHVKIRGFCDHNNYGGVGMAVPDRVKLHVHRFLAALEVTDFSSPVPARYICTMYIVHSE